MTNRAAYTLTKGLPWERLVVVKDRRTRRLVKVQEARGAIKTSNASVVEFAITLTNKGEIFICLTAEQTRELPVGDLEFDVIATCNRLVYYTGQSSSTTQPVIRGIISVSESDDITPSEDSQKMEIRFKQYVDFRRNFTWRDANGDIIAVTDAYMQAKNAAGTTVLDLRWYATAPNEATIIGLTANRRGYIAPAAGATLEIHISDANSIPAGNHAFDLFVKDSAGDWDNLASGVLFVQAAVSTPPA
jgi:hypothetical protein